MATDPKPRTRTRNATVKTQVDPVEATPETSAFTEPATPVIQAEPVIEPAGIETAAIEHGKVKKTKKPKLVRDSFTIPQDEYAGIDALKSRCLSASVAVKKSELLRAGLLALQQLSDEKLIDIVNQLEKIKTGRPAK